MTHVEHIEDKDEGIPLKAVTILQESLLTSLLNIEYNSPGKVVLNPAAREMIESIVKATEASSDPEVRIDVHREIQALMGKIQLDVDPANTEEADMEFIEKFTETFVRNGTPLRKPVQKLARDLWNQSHTGYYTSVAVFGVWARDWCGVSDATATPAASTV